MGDNKTPGSPDVERPARWATQHRRIKVATPAGDARHEIKYYCNAMDMDFVRVPARGFVMGGTLSSEAVDRRWLCGSVNDLESEHPAHRMCLTRDFLLGASGSDARAVCAIRRRLRVSDGPGVTERSLVVQGWPVDPEKVELTESTA